jgi:hypothetical protein
MFAGSAVSYLTVGERFSVRRHQRLDAGWTAPDGASPIIDRWPGPQSLIVAEAA